MEYLTERIIEGTRHHTALVLLREAGVYRRAECHIPLDVDASIVIEQNLLVLFEAGQTVTDGTVFWMKLSNDASSKTVANIWLAMLNQLDSAEYPELAYLISAGVGAMSGDAKMVQRYNKLVNALRQAPQQQQQDFISLLTMLLGNSL